MIYRQESDCAEIRRGRIYYVFADDHKVYGSEQASGRPALVVSNDKCNAFSSVIEICYLTTRAKKSLPTHVYLYSEYSSLHGYGKLRSSTVLCEQICSVDISRIGEYYGELKKDEMEKIDRALAISIGLIETGGNV